jgi:hypothetical protein
VSSRPVHAGAGRRETAGLAGSLARRICRIAEQRVVREMMTAEMAFVAEDTPSELAADHRCLREPA